MTEADPRCLRNPLKKKEPPQFNKELEEVKLADKQKRRQLEGKIEELKTELEQKMRISNEEIWEYQSILQSLVEKGILNEKLEPLVDVKDPQDYVD